MSNGSDCRFRKIVTDMSDCEDAIEELFKGVTDDGRPLSEGELQALRRLIVSCVSVVDLVADAAKVTLDLDVVERSLDRVLSAANGAELEARYDARDERVLLSTATK